MRNYNVNVDKTIEDALLAFVVSLDESVSKDQYFGPNVDLFDYGYLDSFGIVGLIAFVDQNYGLNLSNVDFYDTPNRTIAGIAKLIGEGTDLQTGPQ